MTTIDERVAAGAAWLDEHRPGWWQRINLDTLDLGDPCKCVLGQEYGQFGNAPDEMWDHGSNAHRRDRAMGFNAEAVDFGRGDDEFDALTAAWRTLITARRDAAADEGTGGEA